MIFSSERTHLRQLFFTAWAKHSQQQALEPLEQQIVRVILEHPEYQDIFIHPEQYQDKDYFPELGETNPFLHLSLHLSIREQVNMNRPAGINIIFQQLCLQMGNQLAAEHACMDVLAEAIWHMQRTGQEYAENNYLAQLRNLLK